jgi:hypothetical protein
MPLHDEPRERQVDALTDKQRITQPFILSLISIFAALNIVADVLPLTPVLGVNGASFRLGWVVAPLTGLLLGPIGGGVSCVMAGVIELFLGFQSSQPFGLFAPFRMGLSAVQVGLLGKGRWKTALTILGSLIFVWALLPKGREALPVLSFQLVGFFLVLVFRTWIGRYVSSSSWKQVALGVAIAVYCGNISRHLLGNILLVVLTDLPSIVFVAAMPFTVIEQTSFLAASTILGVALLRTRARAFIEVYGESKIY